MTIVGKMVDALSHRGPDGRGCWAEGPVALGHRRLAILDLSPAGAQPMTSPTGRYVIVLNGEIYNFERLRTELIGSGFRFQGSSDTEVLLAGFDHWGIEEAIRRCIGMFALAVWDRAERCLFLGRDRMGEKPLYYGWQGDAFIFGSELKALRRHPSFSGALDPGAVRLLLRHAYIPAPRSIYLGIRKVRCGELIRLDPMGQESGAKLRLDARPKRYWSPSSAFLAGRDRQFSGTVDEAADALEEQILDAVRLQMRADVPVGAFLSGGVDSSLVVAMMQKQSNRPIHTYNIGFGETGFDESEHADRVARHIGTLHCSLRLSPDAALDVVTKLPVMYDEPLADPSQIPTYHVAALARREVTVALSGDGGDELFGGYQKYAAGAQLITLKGRRFWAYGLRSPIVQRAAALVDRLGISGYDAAGRIAFLSTLLSSDALALARGLADNCREFEPWLPSAPEIGASLYEGLLPDARWSFGETATFLDLETYLPDNVLTKVDRACMAVALESRTPLLDHRVVELALRLPWYHRGGRSNEKVVLRRVLSRYVPPALVERPKMGFSVPLAGWLRGRLRPWAEDLLSDGLAYRDQYLDMDRVNAVWKAHLSGRVDRSAALWAVLSFLAWRRLN